MADKHWPSAAAAVADIRDGMTVLIGGFNGVGTPYSLIRALAARGVRDLTVVHTAATLEVTPLLEAGCIRKMITSWATFNTGSRRNIFAELWREGKIELENVPQGTLAERLRAGGAGIPAFYTTTGVGTPVAEGKPTAAIDGRLCLLERALRGDVALIKATRADDFGNLIYHGTARNFNPLVALAADTGIAEVDELVSNGALDPDAIVTPGIFVQRIVRREKRGLED